MCWRPLRVLLRKPSGLSCEIVSDLCLNPFSHDWHVQPSCQRPNIACPPERRVSSPGGTRIARIRLSSKPFNHTCCEKPCQRKQLTEFPRDFHIGKDLVGGTGSGSNQVSKFQGLKRFKIDPKTFTANGLRLFFSTQRYCLPLQERNEFGASRSGRPRIDKRTKLLEVLALKVPFGSLLDVSESSPVAGAIRESIPLKP